MPKGNHNVRVGGTTASMPTTPPRLGLRPNIGQFVLLVGVNALVGGMVGQERTVVPLLATDVFGLAALSSALTFIVAFGLTKAVTNPHHEKPRPALIVTTLGSDSGKR